MEGQAESRQWHTSEIAGLLEETSAIDDVTLYQLNIALEGCKTLEYVGRMVWRLKGGSESVPARFDITELAYGILKRVGRPLTLVELRLRILRQRGLHKEFLVFTPGRGIARLDDGRLGLVERDFGAKENRERLLDALYKTLEASGRAIHEEEIAGFDELHSPLTAHMAMALAREDGRFRVFRGDYLGLTTWSGPRRKTLEDAIREVVAAEGDSFVGGSELQEKLERLLGRPVGRGPMCKALRVAGFEPDASNQRWVLAETMEELSDLNRPGFSGDRFS